MIGSLQRTTRPALARRLERVVLAASLFAGLFLPLASPLRATVGFEAGTLLPILIPAIVVAFAYTAGPAALYRIRPFQAMLLLVIIQSMLVGVTNSYPWSVPREFVSHIFQLFSAFILYGCGHVLAGRLTARSLRRAAMTYGLGFVVGSVVTIALLGQGEVPRYYTPSYAALLPLSYTAANGLGLSSALLMGFVFAANKRAVLVASFALLLASAFIAPNFRMRRRVRSKSRIKILVFAALPMLSLAWAVTVADPDSTWGPTRAIRLSIDRITPSFFSEGATDRTTAGRTSEAEAALESSSGAAILLGGGAGWSFEHNGRRLHNVHISPISLTCVFGLPLVIIVYYHAVTRAVRVLRRSGPGIERTCALYVIGGLIHSVFAFSLFVDVLFFFLVGAVAKYSESRTTSVEMVE
jgi:hypothetical protein